MNSRFVSYRAHGGYILSCHDIKTPGHRVRRQLSVFMRLFSCKTFAGSELFLNFAPQNAKAEMAQLVEQFIRNE